ncbi:MAG: (2Fe-2S)-binding protein [Acidimicrobiales bacterium]
MTTSPEPELLRYRLRVNGGVEEVDDARLEESLLFVLRERLGLYATKNACEEGECGSCSVLIDGRVECACTVLAASAIDRDIVTLEGLSPDDGPDDIQRAFVEEGAVQCGFCTPGLIVAVSDLLSRTADPTETQIREAISGNLCRCTGYGRIIAAVKAVAEARS